MKDRANARREPRGEDGAVALSMRNHKTALLLFSGHLKNACERTHFLQLFHRRCKQVFLKCESVIVTYSSRHGTTRASRTLRNGTSGGCLDKLRTVFPQMVTVVRNESHDATRVANIYPVRYLQMIQSIRIGLAMVGHTDVVLRLRPDAGIQGINGIISLSTWRTLARLPENSIRQYGTWQMRDGSGSVNGDNCFAGTWETFERFTFFWERDFPCQYMHNLEHIEWTMHAVAVSQHIQLLPPPLPPSPRSGSHRTGGSWDYKEIFVHSKRVSC